MGSESSKGTLNCNQEKYECTIYKNEGMTEYVYKLDVNMPNPDPPQFIFIVDKSGSMGSSCEYIISKTIPQVLKTLGYGAKKNSFNYF